MKHLFLAILAALGLLATPQARAWTYNQGDVLLIFRNGAQDVEFDLGNVTNFLGHANGYTTIVNGWNSNLVNNTFGGFSGLNIAILASVGTSNWLSGAEPDTAAYNISSSGAQTLNSIITGVGNKPLIPIPIPTAATNAYSIDVTGQYKKSSYDYVVSGGTYNGIPYFDGSSAFAVEQTIPSYLDFWAVSPTTVYPNSPPDKLVGTFTISATGLLTFTAGPRPPSVSNIAHASNVSAIQFATTVGNTYSIAYTNKLGAAISQWPIDPTTLVGDGRTDTLYHTNSGNVEFYNIQAQ